ncbi:MAG: TonB-dependent receptor, partial [Cellulomonas sp.]|nr:TonB-dependent receptor [Rickettsiella sp.]
MQRRSVAFILAFTFYFHSLWAKDTTLPLITVTAAIDKKPSNLQLPRKNNVNSDTAYGNEKIEVAKKFGMNTQQLLSKLAGVSIGGGPLAINQTPTFRGLSGNELNSVIDGVSNSFRGFGHNNMRLLPGSELLKSITVDGSGDSLYGSGNMGGSIEYTTLDPQDYLRPGEKMGGELSQEFQTGAPGFKSTVAVFSQWGKVSALFKISGDRFHDIHLGNGKTLPYSAQNNLQYLGKIVITPDAYQTVKLSILSLQNVGTYSSLLNTSNPNSLSNFNLLQQQQMLDYSFKPGSPYINFKAKLYHLDINQTLKPVEENKDVFPQAIDIDTIGIFLKNTSKLGDNYLTYGMESAYQRGKDLYSGTTGNFPRAHATQYAGFLRDKFDLTSKLQTIVGLRFDTRQSSNGILSNQVSHLGKEFGLNYHLTPIFSVYTKYAEGFRYPT